MQEHRMEEKTTLVKDVVCGMMIDPATAAAKSDYDGQTYYFCAKGCQVAFDKNPQKYLSPMQPAP
jgi:YHS domain-containing protein